MGGLLYENAGKDGSGNDCAMRRKLPCVQRTFGRQKAMPRLPGAGRGNHPEELPELHQKTMCF